MRRMAIVAILVVLLVFSGIAFAFQNEPEGFRDLKWGDPPREDMELAKRFEDPDVCWYRRPNDELEIERARIEQIAYGFYENRLWRVHITAKHDFVFLTGVVKEKFGPEGHRYTFKGGWCYQWLGDIALVDLWWKSGVGSRLEIRSIKINSELQEEERRKKEERKDEKNSFGRNRPDSNNRTRGLRGQEMVCTGTIRARAKPNRDPVSRDLG